MLDLGTKLKIPRVFMATVLVAGVIMTSGYQKYSINTSIWPPSWFVSQQEVQGYSWLNTLPLNERVFDLEDPRRVLAYDKFSCIWCDPEKEFYAKIANQSLEITAEETYTFLKDNKYPYAVISASFVRDFGINRTNALLQDMSSYGRFIPVYVYPQGDTPHFIAFRVS